MGRTESQPLTDFPQSVRDLARAMAEGLETRHGVGSKPFCATPRNRTLTEIPESLRAGADLLRVPAIARPGPFAAVVRRARGVFRAFLKPWLGVQSDFNRELLQVVEALHREVGRFAGRIEELNQQAVNRELSSEGDIAQAGLWFNPAVAVQLQDAGPAVVSVSERILEPIFVHTRLPAPPARVLDLGCAESTNPAEMASLGYDVVGVDLRPHPLEQRSFRMLRGDVTRLPLGNDSFDVVVSLSTLEHVGLAWYADHKAGRSDRRAVAEVGRVLRKGGRFILTIPFGEAATTPVQRIYDSAGLDGLLADFRRVETVYGVRDGESWSICEDERRARMARSLDRSSAVALIVAEKP
jgi:SAM-dependent methyltransferase